MKDVLNKKKAKAPTSLEARRKIVFIIMQSAMLLLVARAIFLQVFDSPFLQRQGERRHIAKVSIPAYRGKILDRNNEPLAISTPVATINVDPLLLLQEDKDNKDPFYLEKEEAKFRQVAKLLHISKEKTAKLLNPENTSRFARLKRQATPDLVKKIKDLNVKGVYFERNFKRFYPSGAVSAHMLGFTDLNDVGQEGIERAYESSLKGIPGKKRVIIDGKRRAISDVENIKEPEPGQNIILSIDQRLQYLAFKALEAGVLKDKAESASLVVLDTKTGELLAAVNQPSFNPNTRKGLVPKLYRNRAILDTFEPGSTVKPFVVAAALEAGFVGDLTEIETNGHFRVGRNLVRDTHNYGTLDVMHVLKKSSNIGASKIALMMPSEYMWGKYHKLGFGSSTYTGFPGESNGTLPGFEGWNDFKQATLSFGYGLSVTTLQLARAYTALADDGLLHSISLLKRDKDEDSQRVFSAKVAKQVREMLENVVKKGGTATQARVDGYRVAGKTGTIKKAIPGGYSKDHYFAAFVGLAPVSNPRFVIAVMVNQPSAGKYYGGLVAAPIFAKVMAGALKLYGVEPDQEDTMPILLQKSPLE